MIIHKTNKMKYTFKNKISRLTVIFLILGTNILYSQTRIEGLSYLDKKPVSVEINDGKIVSVQRIDKLTDRIHAVYIAPGLIDNQVNGFAGVSFNFTGGELDKEGILKITRELWKKGGDNLFSDPYFQQW